MGVTSRTGTISVICKKDDKFYMLFLRGIIDMSNKLNKKV